MRPDDSLRIDRNVAHSERSEYLRNSTLHSPKIFKKNFFLAETSRRGVIRGAEHEHRTNFARQPHFLMVTVDVL